MPTPFLAWLHRYTASIQDPEAFWAGEARETLAWFHPPHATRQVPPDGIDVAWFPGGRLNAAWLCLDRHLPTRGEQTALIWAKDEAGAYERFTFRQLHAEVCRMANVLGRHGVRKGDRVCLYLPMIPALPVAMLACARIGAVHSVVFAGFSAQSLRDRVVDAGAAVVLTADEGLRGGKTIPLKVTVDEALDGLPIRSVLVARRTGRAVRMVEGRDFPLEEELAKERPVAPAEWMDSEDPLFLLYTSGSTGRPKGVMHTTAGYLLHVASTHRHLFDVREGDVHFCTADLGWITGHGYVVYGPLCNGTTSVLFESVPTFPDAGRYWAVCDDLRVTTFYTAPTALRAIAREGDDHVLRYRRDSLRVLGTVGEPINPDVWRWYERVVGGGRCPVIDTWWQTETGGVLIAPFPGITPPKPGAATRPFFGVEPVIVDDRGRELHGNGVSGNLCIRGSWPGRARTISGDHQRFVQTYFSTFRDAPPDASSPDASSPDDGTLRGAATGLAGSGGTPLYFTGDGCRRDEDGDYWITGRVDDVLNVAGHRLGTAEIESALVTHPLVAEAAVVGFPHDVKGTGIYAFVLLLPGADVTELEGALKATVRQQIGPIATPDRVHIAQGLPKTRSGKIMRRILRKIASAEYDGLGDLSTLSEPAVVERLVAEHREREPSPGRDRT